MISTFILACFLLLMMMSSFVVGMVITYMAFRDKTLKILDNEDMPSVYKLTVIKKLFDK